MSPPTKQRNQQRMWQALGTVKGFHGYLHNSESVVKACPKLAVDKYFLEKDIRTLRNRLHIMEEALRQGIKEL